MKMKRAKTCDICFSFDAGISSVYLDWSSRKVFPDYKYKTDREIIGNELHRRNNVLKLGEFLDPANTLSYYFSIEKNLELESFVKEYLAANSDDSHDRYNLSEELAFILNSENFESNVKSKIHEANQNNLIKSNKNIQVVRDAARIYNLKSTSKMSLSAISLETGLSRNRTSYIWRLIKETGNKSLIARYNQGIDQISLRSCFRSEVDSALLDDPECSLSLKAIQTSPTLLNAGLKIRNFAHFYHLMKSHGYVYQTFCTSIPYRITWNEKHVEFTKLLIAELISNTEEFEIFWTDETSICPQNYKKRCWGARGKQTVISSNLQYTSLKLFGLISSSELYSMQIHKGSSSHLIFDNFIIESLKRYFRRSGHSKIVTLFLDNSTLHKSKSFLDFCTKNRIFLIFNLPHCPTLNPIELLWRFLKSPLKKICRTSQ
jgi:hypothetical protein